jgi:hypothetical protein
MVTSQELGYKNEAKFFVFERCVLYTTVVLKGKSCSYENHFWIKDVSVGSDGKSGEKMFAELKNCDHRIYVDNTQMIALLTELKTRHEDDEITAEIDMISDDDLRRIVDGMEESRRHSIVSTSSFREQK